MGDLGEEDTDKLDEQIWGSDDEEDPEESDVCSECVCYLFKLCGPYSSFEHGPCWFVGCCLVAVVAV